ncbi:MAG TPA: hypothetical protein VE732_06315 [Nitrososphaera sp.]|nr:hypothetical protein [Nitrososphaera sp.]
MRIARSKNQDGTLAPSALNYLGHIPDNCHFINQHARRPPLGIYNVSFEQLIADFSNLLDEYFKTREFIRENTNKLPSGEGYYEGLLKAQKDLIHSLQAHVDDCYAILASLIDPATVSPKVTKIRFTDRWLDAIGFPTLDRFKKSISEYRDNYLAHLVNGLKHRQNRLRGIFFYNAREIRLGYYLEEPDVDGVPGPSFNLHEDGNSAFSFAKDILFNLYHVYYLSEMLVEAFSEALQHYQSFTLNPQKVSSENDKWLGVIRLALRIQPQVFPSELDKPYPYFSFNENDGDQSLVLMYPVTLIPLKFPQGMRIFGIFKADGVSKTFRIPYLKPSKYGGIR